MGLPGVAGRAVSRPGCCTPRVKPSFEVQKSEGDRAFGPGFLRRETGVRSGCVAGPAAEPLPCSLSRGSKAHGAERSLSRGPGVEDSQHRGRGVPEED